MDEKENNIFYKETKNIPCKLLFNLYKDVGWTNYTNNTKKLCKSLKKSLYVLTAWDRNILIGLIRVVGDGISIIYIKDLLILKKYQRKKIGTTLMKKTLEKFKDVRQKVLLTDNEQKTVLFYKSLGFIPGDKKNLIAFVRIKD